MLLGSHDGLFIGQVIIACLILTLIFMTARNYKIAKLIIRDKTIMFVEVENTEAYDKFTGDKTKRFKLTEVDENNKEIVDDDKLPD